MNGVNRRIDCGVVGCVTNVLLRVLLLSFAPDGDHIFRQNVMCVRKVLSFARKAGGETGSVTTFVAREVEA